MMRKGANRDMCFCEGKQWNYPNLGNCYWCHGNAAFCDGVITHSDYHNYTLYDIIDIIGGDNKRQLGIQFVYSGYNRLASLIEHEHIFCKSCKCALEPKGDNGYNARRAIWFQCNNAQCDQYKKEIYLNHCFQENCGAIIDSRETSKCPNGFYICKTCGVCCANSQFKRKINANVNLGLYISTLIREGKMHLDGGVEPSFYCSTCGKKLTHIRFKTALKIDDNNYIYGYYKCPDHKDSLIVFPYSEYVKKKVLKYIHDYENDTQNRDGKDF